MFSFRCRSGISEYKNIFNAKLLLKRLFYCIFREIAFYIRYTIGRFRFGGRLRGITSKLLINKIIKMLIRCKIGRFGVRGLKI